MIQYFTKIWYILGSSKKQVPLLLFVFIVSSITEAFGIGLLGPFFAIISDPAAIQKISFSEQVLTGFGIQSNETFIGFLCILISVVFVLKSVLYFFSKFFILSFSHSHRGKMIEVLNHTYLESDYSYFISKNSSSLVKNIAVETQGFCLNVLLSLLYGISNLFILVFLLILMAATDIFLFVAILLTLIPVFILIFGMKYRLISWGRTLSESAQNMIKTLNHGLGGFKETRIIGCAPYFEEQMASYTRQYVKAASLSTSFDMLPRILIETALVVFVVAFIAISQIFLSRNTDSMVASLSVFAVASIRLLPAASQVMSSFGKIPTTKHLVDVLHSDLKESEKQLSRRKITKAHDSGIALENSVPMNFLDQIQLSGISYKYSKDLDPAIAGVALKIHKGESIAFIGQSGAGKTTLVDIILGLLTPQDGDITVDDVSIYKNLRAWQNLVGYIPQSIFLLDETVERNIAFGVPDHMIDHKKIEEAIDAAQLTELVAQLPNGLQTRVGERGVMLSGGQRQRIGIARALYHEREVLVLDEATSALDNETEQQVSKAIRDLSGKKTVIIIAHRLSTVEHCDRVYLLEKGRIVKSGSYSEVLMS